MTTTTDPRPDDLYQVLTLEELYNAQKIDSFWCEEHDPTWENPDLARCQRENCRVEYFIGSTSNYGWARRISDYGDDPMYDNGGLHYHLKAT